MPRPRTRRLCEPGQGCWRELGKHRRREASLGFPLLRSPPGLRRRAFTATSQLCPCPARPPRLPASPGTCLSTAGSLLATQTPPGAAYPHLPGPLTSCSLSGLAHPWRSPLPRWPCVGMGGLTEEEAFCSPAQLRLLASRSRYLPAQPGGVRGPHHKCARPDVNRGVRGETKP